MPRTVFGLVCIVTAAFVLCMGGSAAAQRTENSLSIENYTPPPMFGEDEPPPAAPQKTRVIIQPAKRASQSPLSYTERRISRHAPVPARKPDGLSEGAPAMQALPAESIDVEMLPPPPGQPAKTIEDIAKNLISPETTAKDNPSPPPIPPHRPKRVFVSKDFAEKLRLQSLQKDVDNDKSSGNTAAASLYDTPPPRLEYRQGTGKQVVRDLTVQDILESIDPEEARRAEIRPAPAPSKPADLQTPRSISFAPGSTELPNGLPETVRSDVMTFIQTTPHAAIKLKGYASNASDHNTAKRLALFRTMTVRDFLVKAGVPAGAIEMRPLETDQMNSQKKPGDQSPPERVDIILTQKN